MLFLYLSKMVVLVFVARMLCLLLYAYSMCLLRCLVFEVRAQLFVIQPMWYSIFNSFATYRVPQFCMSRFCAQFACVSLLLTCSRLNVGEVCAMCNFIILSSCIVGSKAWDCFLYRPNPFTRICFLRKLVLIIWQTTGYLCFILNREIKKKCMLGYGLKMGVKYTHCLLVADFCLLLLQWFQAHDRGGGDSFKMGPNNLSQSVPISV